MPPFESFEDFLTSARANIPIAPFLLNIVLTAVLAFVLQIVYVKCASTLSNRRAFAGNFMLLATTTMLIISIVKASLALSLGLVGALSIVRFRAAIKEPQELSYLFLCIAIGLGCGADQASITVLAFAAIVLIIALKKGLSRTKKNQANLHMTIRSTATSELGLAKIVEILREHCLDIDLRRFDETSEASFQVEIARMERLAGIRSALEGQSKSVHVTFIDTKWTAVA